MERMTITQFIKYYQTKHPKSIIYDSTNNCQLNRIGVTHPASYQSVHTVLRFIDVATMLNPNKVCFKSDGGTLCFEGVTEIRLENKGFCDTAYIYCKNSDTVYTVIFE